jgi:hypothetical protein
MSVSDHSSDVDFCLSGNERGGSDSVKKSKKQSWNEWEKLGLELHVCGRYRECMQARTSRWCKAMDSEGDCVEK